MRNKFSQMLVECLINCVFIIIMWNHSNKQEVTMECTFPSDSSPRLNPKIQNVHTSSTDDDSKGLGNLIFTLRSISVDLFFSYNSRGSRLWKVLVVVNLVLNSGTVPYKYINGSSLLLSFWGSCTCVKGKVTSRGVNGPGLRGRRHSFKSLPLFWHQFL